MTDTECKWCGCKNVQLITFKNGTKKLFCPECNCYYVSGKLMNENLKKIREARKKDGEQDG